MWDFVFPPIRSPEAGRQSRAGSSTAIRNLGSFYLSVLSPTVCWFCPLSVCLMITRWLLYLQALPLSSRQKEEKKKKQEGVQGEGSRPAQLVPFLVGKQRPFWSP